MSVSPLIQEKNAFNHVTHNIASVAAPDLQTSNADIKDKNIIEYRAGLNYIDIDLNITAPGGFDVQPTLQLYFENTLKEFNEGAVSPLTFVATMPFTPPAAAIIPAGTSGKIRLQSILAANQRCALCLVACPVGTKIIISANRHAGDGANR